MPRRLLTPATAALIAGPMVIPADARDKPSQGQRGAVNVRKAMEAGAMVNPRWPAEWKVFGPLPPEFTKLAAEQLKAVPAELTIDGKKYAPRTGRCTSTAGPTGGCSGTSTARRSTTR